MTTTPEAGLLEATDEQQNAYAIAEDRVHLHPRSRGIISTAEMFPFSRTQFQRNDFGSDF